MTHPKFERKALTYKVTEGKAGWYVHVVDQKSKKVIQKLEVAFPREEYAEKVGQAILDFSYGDVKISVNR